MRGSGLAILRYDGFVELCNGKMMSVDVGEVRSGSQRRCQGLVETGLALMWYVGFKLLRKGGLVVVEGDDVQKLGLAGRACLYRLEVGGPLLGERCGNGNRDTATTPPGKEGPDMIRNGKNIHMRFWRSSELRTAPQSHQDILALVKPHLPGVTDGVCGEQYLHPSLQKRERQSYFT